MLAREDPTHITGNTSTQEGVVATHAGYNQTVDQSVLTKQSFIHHPTKRGYDLCIEVRLPTMRGYYGKH